MRSSRCVYSTAAALHRVFVAPSLSISQRTLLRTTITPSICSSRPSAYASSQRRGAQNLVRAEKHRLPRDDEIKAPTIIVVGEDGKMALPRSTRIILGGLDRSTETLVMVRERSTDEEGYPVPPICRIWNKKEMRDREREQKKAGRKTAVVEKKLELNWAIDKGDLGHRLSTIKKFLEKGNRVEILLLPKKGMKKRKATEAEARELVSNIKAVLEEVPGSREQKAQDGKLLGQLTIFLEGKKGDEGKDQKSMKSAKVSEESDTAKRPEEIQAEKIES